MPADPADQKPSPMHVVYHAPSWPPGAGRPNGIVTALSHTVPAMRARGHAVSIVTPKLLADEGVGEWGEHIYAVRAGPKSLLGRAKAKVADAVNSKEAWLTAMRENVASAVRRADDRAPVTVFESEESFGLAMHVIDEGVFPVVIRSHGPARAMAQTLGMVVDEAQKQRIANEENSVRKAAGLTAPSQATLSVYSNVDTLKTVIFNPIPTPSIPTGSLPRDHIVFVGRIDRLKGADVAIEAAAAAMMERPTLRMSLCGIEAGIERPDGEKRTFAEFVAEEVPPTLRDRFRYLGVLPPSEVSALRGQASIVLVTSRTEAFPYSVSEAMVQGCAVIGTDTFGIPELIEHERTGLLIPPEDVDATAAAILRLTDDAQLAATLGRHASAWAAEHLNPDVLAAKTESFYREAVQAHRARTGKAK